MIIMIRMGGGVLLRMVVEGDIGVFQSFGNHWEVLILKMCVNLYFLNTNYFEYSE